MDLLAGLAVHGNIKIVIQAWREWELKNSRGSVVYKSTSVHTLIHTISSSFKLPLPNLVLHSPNETLHKPNMQLSTILLLGSAAVVSAVDLTRYNGVDCNNYFLVWNNLEPDVCYSWRIFDLKFGSVQWSAIPQGQKLNVAMYGDLSCSDLISPPGASIEDTTCFSGKLTVNMTRITFLSFLSRPWTFLAPGNICKSAD